MLKMWSIYIFQVWGAGERVGVPRLETHMSKGVAHVRNKRPKISLHEQGKKGFLQEQFQVINTEILTKNFLLFLLM